MLLNTHVGMEPRGPKGLSPPNPKNIKIYIYIYIYFTRCAFNFIVGPLFQNLRLLSSKIISATQLPNPKS